MWTNNNILTFLGLSAQKKAAANILNYVKSLLKKKCTTFGVRDIIINANRYFLRGKQSLLLYLRRRRIVLESICRFAFETRAVIIVIRYYYYYYYYYSIAIRQHPTKHGENTVAGRMRFERSLPGKLCIGTAREALAWSSIGAFLELSSQSGGIEGEQNCTSSDNAQSEHS